MSELTPALFARLRDQVYAQTGLFFDERKQYFFARRLERRMEALRLASPAEYCEYLRSHDGKGRRELLELAEALTTNETYFFREYPQLQAFADEILQETLEEKRRRDDYTLRLWCAGCSTGEEAYTLAIILREMIEDFPKWKVELTATDLSREVLQTARRAVYGERSIKDVPTVYLQRYFREEGGLYRVSPVVTSMVRFQNGNLSDPQVAEGMQDQDFVFCRNVLIYFDDQSRRRTVEMFYEVLREGGYIFLGHSESVGRITSAFRLVRKGGMLAYVK